MSLAVPTSRASILRPLNESVDFDENPDTPGTTYSFQEQSAKPMNTQTGTVPPHLAAAMMDASMLISTDDEMLDSDSDQRRDEDYDIDIDAEVYSVNDGDPEVTMSMEEDIIAYGRLEQDDDDDIMLDDEPTDDGHGYDVNHDGHNMTATQADTQLDPSSSIAPALSHQETSFLQQPSPHQVNFERQDQEASSQPILSQSNVAIGITEPQTECPGNSGNGGGDDPVGLDQAQEQDPQHQPSPVSHQDISPQHNILLEEGEENDGTQSSTATLAHEVVRNDEHVAGEDNDSTPVPKHESQPELEADGIDAGLVGAEDPFDSLYQHPVIVQYEQNQLTLFPSMAVWSNDPVLANVYSDLPSDYLLPDVGVCEKPLSELFMHLRDVLGPAVGMGSEMIVEIELLGLKMGEDNMACKSVSLRRVLDLHNQLHENDGYDIPMPVTMSLYTVPRFLSRLQEIADVVRDRKGLRECLGRLGLPSADEYSNEREEAVSRHETDTADYNGKPNEPNSPQDPTIESREDSNSPCATQQQLEDAEIIEIQDAIAVNPDTEHPNVETEDEIQVNTQKESGASRAQVIIQQSITEVPSHTGSNVVDDEELLEDFDDDGQDTAEQPDISGKNENVQSETDGFLGVVDEVQPLPESDVAPAGPLSAELEVTEEEHAPSTVVDSGEHDTPSNVNDNSNKPSPIHVYEEDQGEYDEAEEYGYEQATHQYQKEEQQGTESSDREQPRDDFEEEIHGANSEDYEEEHFQDGEAVSYAESVHQEKEEEDDAEYDAPGDYDEGQGEYNQQDESVYVETEEIEEYEVEEYDSPYKSPENQSSPDEIEVSVMDAIDVTAIRSPSASIAADEEELIDFEDDEELALLPRSPTSLKRVRGDSDAEGDDELDEDQATKRARAE